MALRRPATHTAAQNREWTTDQANQPEDELGAWQAHLARLDKRLRQHPTWADEAPALCAMQDRARRVLSVLSAAHAHAAARRGPRLLRNRIGAALSSTVDGELLQEKPFAALKNHRQDRECMLRLGMWALLDELFELDAGHGHDRKPFELLMCRIAGGSLTLPAALLPHEDSDPAVTPFARQDAAAVFFNACLRPVVHNLTRLHPQAGFQRWLLPDYEPGISNPQPYGRLWTVCTVATYADWLRLSSTDGSIAAAMTLIWSDPRVNFRPPRSIVQRDGKAAAGEAAPAVLPTGHKTMRIDLHLGLLLAQVLDYRAERWHAARQGAAHFVVDMPMRRLHQYTTRHWDGDHHVNTTLYSGLSIEHLYQAACIERFGALRHNKADERG